MKEKVSLDSDSPHLTSVLTSVAVAYCIFPSGRPIRKLQLYDEDSVVTAATRGRQGIEKEKIHSLNLCPR